MWKTCIFCVGVCILLQTASSFLNVYKYDVYKESKTDRDVLGCCTPKGNAVFLRMINIILIMRVVIFPAEWKTVQAGILTQDFGLICQRSSIKALRDKSNGRISLGQQGYCVGQLLDILLNLKRWQVLLGHSAYCAY